MSCSVLYDISGTFWSDRTVGVWITIGLVGTIVPLVIIILGSVIGSFSGARVPHRVVQVVLGLIGILALVGSLTQLLAVHKRYDAILENYAQGHYDVLAGNVENFSAETFHPVVPGHFEIAKHSFLWDPSGYVQEFTAATISLNGAHWGAPTLVEVLHDGMPLRVRYSGERILRIETSQDLPAESGVKSESCEPSR